MSAAQAEGQHFEPRAVFFCQLTVAEGHAMQAELWQWMEGQTFTAASAFPDELHHPHAPGFLRPRVSTAGRSSSPLGRIMYTIRQKVMPENMVRHSLS